MFAAGHRVADLGTEFVIRSDANHLTVALLEGRARFESTDIWSAHQSAMLSPGDIVEASGKLDVHVKTTLSRVCSNKLAWRRGVLVFENATLAEAAKELESLYNAKKVVINDDAVARLKFDSTNSDRWRGGLYEGRTSGVRPTCGNSRGRSGDFTLELQGFAKTNGTARWRKPQFGGK